MGSYGENYEYGMSPAYKDDTNSGLVFVSKVDPITGDLIPKEFTVIDVIPAKFKFSFTGIPFTPRAYLWDFGDGTSSTEPNPIHTYNTVGYHKVVLSAKNSSNVWSYVGGLTPQLIALGKVDFIGSPREGDKPLPVNFIDNSLAPEGCFFTGMQWDFGDTKGATGMQPITHQYNDYGSYTVGVDAFIGKL